MQVHCISKKFNDKIRELTIYIKKLTIKLLFLNQDDTLSAKQFIQSSKRPYELSVFTQCVRAKHARPVLSTRPKIREEHVAIAHAPLATEV